jgi:hypothetical protein
MRTNSLLLVLCLLIGIFALYFSQIGVCNDSMQAVAAPPYGGVVSPERDSFLYYNFKDGANCRILGTWVITNFPPTPAWDM